MLKTFAFLATIYTADGPVIYVLDSGLTGEDCIARMHEGVTSADVLAVIDETVSPSGDAHVPTDLETTNIDLRTAVLSCEFDQ